MDETKKELGSSLVQLRKQEESMKGVLTMMLVLGSISSALADNIDAALMHASRSAQDTADDALRKPGEVMRFFKIERGMSVFDVFAGGGYYSELLSYAVGPEGSVTLYNNNPWNAYVLKAVDARLADNRLPNVRRMMKSPDALIDLDEQHDAAIFILGMHDIYYGDPPNWPAIDKDRFLTGIYALLKEGGVLGVIDHNGTKRDLAGIAKDLHRVDPAQIISDLEAVGFTLEARSEILRNSDDDLSTSVFLPENRRKTDRSVLRFRK